MSKHILVVDDEYPTRYALAATLKDCGYSAHLSVDGGAALETIKKLNSVGKKIELAIVDIQKPGVSVEYFMSEWKKMGTPFPVMITSGYADKAFLVHLLSKGISDFLEKALSAHDRILRVAVLMSGNQVGGL
ncbi:MAG: response regulator [Dissulfurispiraceae bacterium]